MFNQFSLTCADPSEAVPCDQSSQFNFLNERIGVEKALLHEEEDREKAEALYPRNKPESS